MANKNTVMARRMAKEDTLAQVGPRSQRKAKDFVITNAEVMAGYHQRKAVALRGYYAAGIAIKPFQFYGR